MPKLSALIHTHNDAEHLPRVLESLKCCSDVLLIDDNSDDDSQRIARKYGARSKNAIPGVTPGAYAFDTYHDWVLVVRPSEVVSDRLAQSIEEWMQGDKHDEHSGYAFAVQERQGSETVDRGTEMRIVNRRKINWTGELPPNSTAAPQLEGELIRYVEWEQEQAA